MTGGIRLFVALPCYRVVEGRTALCLTGMMRHLGAAELAEQLEVVCVSMQGDTLVARGRSDLVTQALEREATHMLWIDSDMVFPTDVAFQLLQHQEDIVAANCVTRQPPYQPTAIGMDGDFLWTEEGQKGLSPVHHVGLAVALVSMEVFKTMPAPHFQTPHTDEGWIGEDVFFMRAARERGFQPYVDHALSREVKHLGEIACDWNLARGARAHRAEVEKPPAPVIELARG